MIRLKQLVLPSLLVVLAPAVSGGEPPDFFKNTYPDHALESRLQADAVLNGPKAELDAKTRELIALGVAAQIPCVYCVHVHTSNALVAGATDGEIREAVATAARVRHWSTVLNGMAYDLDQFKAEFDKMNRGKE